MKNKIILIGGGGHSKVILDAIRKAGKFQVYGILDAHLSRGTSVLGVKVLGDDGELPGIYKKGVRYAFIAVGSIGDCSVRRAIDDNVKKWKFKLPVIIHPAAVIARDVIVNIQEGTFIAAGAVINPGTHIGRNVIINTSASVDHDCAIGDFVHIAPGVTLSGAVTIGDESHIGTGANIIQNIRVGKKALVGAGRTLRENLGDGKWDHRKFAENDEQE